MSIKRQFGSGVAWMAVGNWIEQSINIVVFVLLARILGAEAYGLLAMAAVFLVVGGALVRETFSDFLIAADAPTPGHFNATFWILAAVGLGLGAFLFALAPAIATFYGEDQVTALIRALTANIIMIALTAVPVAILRRELRFRTLSLRAIAGTMSGGIVAIVLAISGFGVWSLVFQHLVMVFVNIIMAWAAVHWRPGIRMTRKELSEVIRFGTMVLGLRGAENVVAQVPAIMIGPTLGAQALGYFAISWRVVELGSFLIVTPLRMAAQPAFASMRRSGAVAASLLSDISSLTGLLAYPAFAGLAVLAAPLIELLFGVQWAPAAPILAVLAVLGAYFCIEKIHQAFCLAAGRAVATTLISWAEFGLAVLLVWLAAPWGVQAMAGGFVMAFILLWGARFYVVAQIAQRPVGTMLRLHVMPILGALAMAGVVRQVLHFMGQTPLLAQIIAGVLVGVTFFAAFTAIFMPDRFRLLKTFIAKRAAAVDKAP